MQDIYLLRRNIFIMECAKKNLPACPLEFDLHKYWKTIQSLRLKFLKCIEDCVNADSTE